MTRWPIVVAVLMLMSGWGLAQSLSHAELVPAKKPFASFPLTIGQRWQGRELGLDRDVLNVLKLSDYMMRVYVLRDEARGEGHGTSGMEAVPVWLYVGYYQSQRTGATYHSPKNCLPGSGWQMVEAEQVRVTAPGEALITINKVMIEKGLDRQVILYWYQDRGRVIASEYWAKGYLMWDALTRRRTDGALVRISVPVTTTAEAAYREGLAFLQDSWPWFQVYLPAGEERL